LQGEFEKEGSILWHQRDEKMCAATFFRHQAQVDAKAIISAKDRFKRLSANQDASDLAQVDEVTIIRTIQDAIEKRVAMRWDRTANKWLMKHNWQQSPRQMLHARCLTEGVRAINPGLIAGVYIEDEILDIPAEDRGQRTEDRGRPDLEVIERNVQQATANATAERDQKSEVRDQKSEDPADNDEIPGVPTASSSSSSSSSPVPTSISQLPSAISHLPSPSPIPEVTRENYKELVVHIGKAEGEMLGKKVGDLHPNIVDGLYTKWRDKLSPLSDYADLRLKTAVEFAHEAQHRAPAPASAPESAEAVSKEPPAAIERGTEGVPSLSEPSAHTSQRPTPNSQLPTPISESSTKDELIAELRDRCEDLVITEEQACAYLRREGVFETEQHFADAQEKMLRFLLRPDMWSTLKDVVEADVKPKVVDAPPKKRGRRSSSAKATEDL
jgi:hypothetical protein